MSQGNVATDIRQDGRLYFLYFRNSSLDATAKELLKSTFAKDVVKIKVTLFYVSRYRCKYAKKRNIIKSADALQQNQNQIVVITMCTSQPCILKR